MFLTCFVIEPNRVVCKLNDTSISYVSMFICDERDSVVPFHKLNTKVCDESLRVADGAVKEDAQTVWEDCRSHKQSVLVWEDCRSHKQSGKIVGHTNSLGRL